jgi:uncharacterized membrane protein YvlD (DUF360 family)
MSEEKKPTERPAPSQFQSPPPGARPSSEESLRPTGSSQNDQVQAILKRSQNLLDQLGIEVDTALKVLIAAVVFGVIGAVIDKVLELPTGSLYIVFGVWAAVLNGPTYAFFKDKASLAAAVMSAVAGFVGLLSWWIVTKIIGERGDSFFKYNPADSYNILEVFLTGVIAGLIGFGWFVLLERLRSLKIRR